MNLQQIIWRVLWGCCPYCGESTIDGANYCIGCGHDVRAFTKGVKRA